MKVHAIQKNARMAPRKIRPLARLMRGLPAEEALQQLASMPGKAPDIISAVLRSAMANAVHNLDAKKDSLTVSEVLVNEGLVMKRHQPVAKGMAHPILKRTSHVTVVVAGEGAKKKTAKKAAIKTVNAGQYAKAEEKERIEEEKKAAQEQEDMKKAKDAKVKPQESRSVEKREDKRDYEALQKKKIQQQGGDKKKTHRRKSIG